MNRRVRMIPIFMLLLLIISSCSTQPKPETTVSEFVEAMKDFDLELMASKVNSENAPDIEDFTDLYEAEDASLEKYFLDYIQLNAKKITYEIKEARIDGDQAVVSTDFTYVDGGPLFKATLSQYMKEAFVLAFTQPEMTEEENTALFLSALEEQREKVEETFVEKTIEIQCIQIDGKWYIDEPSDEVLNVAMSNVLSVIEDFEESFKVSEKDATLLEEVEDEDMNVIKMAVGEEGTNEVYKIILGK